MVTSNDNQLKQQAQQIKDLSARLSSLSAANSKLLDEVATLKSNYNRLVEDVSARLEVVHEKIFR